MFHAVVLYLIFDSFLPRFPVARHGGHAFGKLRGQ
ncbi:MAG: hypothetical protein ACI93T_004006, partial [Porticoccaceae bacterium]